MKLAFVLLATLALGMSGCAEIGKLTTKLPEAQYTACVAFGKAEPAVAAAIRAGIVKPADFDKVNVAVALGRKWCGAVPQPIITDPVVLASLVTNVAVIVATKVQLGATP